MAKTNTKFTLHLLLLFILLADNGITLDSITCTAAASMYVFGSRGFACFTSANSDNNM
jgi:hypothetical protein